MQHERRFAADPPKRALIFGSPGSGRARVAGTLLQKFSLPVISLDRERRASPDVQAWRQRLRELGQREFWVMIGADLEALDGPLRRADWLVLLNVSMSSCLMRAVRSRFAGARSGSAADVECGLWSAIRDIWEFPTDIAPRVGQAIERERRNRTIYILRSGREVARFLAGLPDSDGSRLGPAQHGAPPN